MGLTFLEAGEVLGVNGSFCSNSTSSCFLLLLRVCLIAPGFEMVPERRDCDRDAAAMTKSFLLEKLED